MRLRIPRILRQGISAWLAAKSSAIKPISPALHQSLASGWASTDPAAAVEWVTTLSDPVLQQEAAAPLFNAWASTGVQGLTEWIAKNSPSPLADSAREQLALNHSDEAPADALAVALQITAPQQATSLGQRILDDWKSCDLPSATQWATANPQSAAYLKSAP